MHRFPCLPGVLGGYTPNGMKAAETSDGDRQGQPVAGGRTGAKTPWADALADVGDFLNAHAEKHDRRPNSTPYTMTFGGRATDAITCYRVYPPNLPELVRLTRSALDTMKDAGLRAPLAAPDDQVAPVDGAYKALLDLSAKAEQAAGLVKWRQSLLLPKSPEEYAAIFKAAIDAANTGGKASNRRRVRRKGTEQRPPKKVPELRLDEGTMLAYWNERQLRINSNRDFDVLLALHKAGGKIVPHLEFAKLLDPERFASSVQALKEAYPPAKDAVRHICKAFKDVGCGLQIEAVRKRGYRLVAAPE